jgi:hypothetical protein
MLLVALLASAVPSVYAGHLPTHGGVVHFDLNPAGAIDIFPAFPGVPVVPVPVVGGPCGAFATREFCNFRLRSTSAFSFPVVS